MAVVVEEDGIVGWLAGVGVVADGDFFSPVGVGVFVLCVVGCDFSGVGDGLGVESHVPGADAVGVAGDGEGLAAWAGVDFCAGVSGVGVEGLGHGCLRCVRGPQMPSQGRHQ